MTPPANWDPPSAKTWESPQLHTRCRHASLPRLCLHGVLIHDFTSSKNCWVRRRICLSSVSSRKFFFRASWLVLISFNSFSSFSNVACKTKGWFVPIVHFYIHGQVWTPHLLAAHKYSCCCWDDRPQPHISTETAPLLKDNIQISLKLNKVKVYKR